MGRKDPQVNACLLSSIFTIYNQVKYYLYMYMKKGIMMNQSSRVGCFESIMHAGSVQWMQPFHQFRRRPSLSSRFEIFASAELWRAACHRPTDRTRHPLTPLRICGIFCESSRVLSFSDVVFMKSVSVRLFLTSWQEI